jgi:hypothetical protein
MVYSTGTRETEVGWGKPSLQEDCEHVLIAIVDGLEDELKWPDEGERARLAVAYEGGFHGCVGIGDVKEFQIKKYKDCVKERRSWSGKKKINSYKMLSVMDHSGRFTFVRLALGSTHCICRKVNTFQRESLLQLMVDLRVMGVSNVPIRIPETIR